MHHQPANPLALLRRARRGDDACARELWSLLAPRLTALARELLISGDPRDVVQSVVLAWFSLPASRIDAIGDFTAHAAASVRNACMNANRGAARERAALARPHASNPPLDAPDQAHGQAPGQSHDLRPALDRLDNPSRELIILKHVGGLTFDQLALCLAQPRGTIVSRYQRALATLNALLHPAAAHTHGTAT